MDETLFDQIVCLIVVVAIVTGCLIKVWRGTL